MTSGVEAGRESGAVWADVTETGEYAMQALTRSPAYG
jgi:hypothetical protein